MPITPSCHSCAGDDVAPLPSTRARATTRSAPTASRRIRSSIAWRSRFSPSSSSASRAGLVGVLGQQQASAASGRHRRPDALMRGASRNPIADSSTVAPGRRARPASAHADRPSASARAGAARSGERAVLVDQRHDVRDRRQRDEIEVALEKRVAGAEQRLRELPDDPGAAEAGERVVALERARRPGTRARCHPAGDGR